MNGWQRFAILILCAFAVMVLYPNFGPNSLSFIGIMLALWTGVIIVLSIISNIFNIYAFEGFNRVISFVLIVAIIASLLWYFPQEDKVTPINKIKYGEFPTKADIDKGLKRFTFNFDFVRRNARRKENFINQEAFDKEKIKKETKKQVKKAADELGDSLDIVVE